MGLLILYLSIAFIGYVVGAKYTNKEKDYKWISKVTTGCLIVLIFTMGARIGSNEEVIRSFQTIGLKAAVISIFAFAGSILGCFLVRKIVKIDHRGVKVDE